MHRVHVIGVVDDQPREKQGRVDFTLREIGEEAHNRRWWLLIWAEANRNIALQLKVGDLIFVGGYLPATTMVATRTRAMVLNVRDIQKLKPAD